MVRTIVEDPGPILGPERLRMVLDRNDRKARGGGPHAVPSLRLRSLTNQPDASWQGLGVDLELVVWEVT